MKNLGWEYNMNQASTCRAVVRTASLLLAVCVAATALSIAGDLKSPGTKALKQLGAQMEAGATAQQLLSYEQHFDRVDADHDGRHSREEFIVNGQYMTRESRQGIFRAADSNGDGFVTRAEYALNRIITDEAKEIIQRMDTDRDGTVSRNEFHKSGVVRDEQLSAEIFKALDANQDGKLLIPEYLKVWGRWAREDQASAEQRVAALRNRLESVRIGSILLVVLDIDGNGALDKIEIERASASLMKLDIDRNGTISINELGGTASGSTSRPGGGGRFDGPPDMDMLSGRFDTNKDGLLDESELPPFLWQHLRDRDTNHDGKVSRQEFETGGR
jgi:Ca2+-binding EF-hand superfamily protein